MITNNNNRNSKIRLNDIKSICEEWNYIIHCCSWDGSVSTCAQKIISILIERWKKTNLNFANIYVCVWHRINLRPLKNNYIFAFKHKINFLHVKHFIASNENWILWKCAMKSLNKNTHFEHMNFHFENVVEVFFKWQETLIKIIIREAHSRSFFYRASNLMLKVAYQMASLIFSLLKLSIHSIQNAWKPTYKNVSFRSEWIFFLMKASNRNELKSFYPITLIHFICFEVKFEVKPLYHG